jgi:hypothetical protein
LCGLVHAVASRILVRGNNSAYFSLRTSPRGTSLRSNPFGGIFPSLQSAYPLRARTRARRRTHGRADCTRSCCRIHSHLVRPHRQISARTFRSRSQRSQGLSTPPKMGTALRTLLACWSIGSAGASIIWPTELTATSYVQRATCNVLTLSDRRDGAVACFEYHAPRDLRSLMQSGTYTNPCVRVSFPMQPIYRFRSR